MCRQISAALLHMCNAFPAEKGEQTILTSFSDVTTTPGIKGKHATASGLSSGFSELNILVTLNKATDVL